MKTATDKSKGKDWTEAVEKALLRTGKTARTTAKMYGTPVYVLKQGKVVAEKPLTARKVDKFVKKMASKDTLPLTASLS